MMREGWAEFVRYWSPDAIATRIDRWLLRMHRPVDPGDGYPAVCMSHRRIQVWPCDEAAEAVERIDGRQRSAR